jgi:hypothetical protein
MLIGLLLFSAVCFGLAVVGYCDLRAVREAKRTKNDNGKSKA